MRVPLNTKNPSQLVYADLNKRGGIIVNFDLTNNIYIGPTQADVTVDQYGNPGPDTSTVGPLNFVTIVAGSDVWGIAETGTPAIEYMPGVTNWAPSPVQAAEQLIAAGLATSANQVTQIGHESNIDSQTATAATQLTDGIGSTALAKHTDITAVESAVNAPAYGPSTAANQSTQITHEANIDTATSTAATQLTDGIAGNQLATHTDVTDTNGYLAGTTSGALVSSAGDTVGKEMAAYIATGTASGTPGGVPLLANPIELYATASTSIPASTQDQLLDNINSATVTDMSGFLSYDILARCEPAAGSTEPFMTFIFQWYGDSAATQLLYQETWTTPGTPSDQINMRGTGPVRAGYLTVGVTNEDSTNAMTMEVFRMYGNSRPSSNIAPDFRTNIGVAPSGYVATAGGKNFDDILGYWSGNLAASADTILLGGLYNGPALLTVNVTGTSPNLEVQPEVWASDTGVIPVFPTFEVGTLADSASAMIYLPRSPIILVLTNQNASDSVGYVVSLIAANTGA